MWVPPFKKEFSKLYKPITCKALRITVKRDCQVVSHLPVNLREEMEMWTGSWARKEVVGF